MLLAERAIDFIGENQRQSGQAQQQHERGANQARPFVDQVPLLDRAAHQHKRYSENADARYKTLWLIRTPPLCQTR